MAVAPRRSRPPKPGKDYYWNGQEWVWIQRMGKGGGKGGGKPAAPPQRPGSTQKTTTIDQWAEAEANRIVEQQLAAIQSQEDAWRTGLQEEAKRRAQQAQAFAQMVQGMGLDKQIQGIFSNAGHDVAGFGAGFSGQVRETADAAAAEMTNLLGGQSAGVRNEGEAMGNVTHGMGGFIPSATLAAQGAAFASDAALQPGFMLQQGLMEAERGLHEGLSDNPFLDAILQTKLSKNDLKTKLREEKIEINLQAQEQKLDALENERDYWLKMQALYLSQKKYKLAAQAEKRARQTETRYANETAGRDAYGNVNPDHYVDNKGRVVPKGYIYNNKGQLVRPKTAAAKDKDKDGLTPNMKQEMVDKVWAAEDNMHDAVKEMIRQKTLVIPAVGPVQPSQIARAKRELLQRFSHLGMNHQTKQALRKLINRVMDDAVKGRIAGSGSGTSGLFD